MGTPWVVVNLNPNEYGMDCCRPRARAYKWGVDVRVLTCFYYYYYYSWHFSSPLSAESSSTRKALRTT